MLGLVIALAALAGASGCATGRAAEPREIPPALIAELQVIQEASSETHEIYVVQQKDTLWSISRRFGTSVEGICKVNGILETDPIKVGQRLMIPVRGTGGFVERAYEPGEVSKAGLVWPVRGRVVGRFGESVGGVACKGVDIEASPGEDVVAVSDGDVDFVSDNFRGLGRVVVMSEGRRRVLYGRLGSISVTPGGRVRRGERIGKAGHGVGSSRIHLRIFEGSQLRDPLGYLP